MEPNHALQIATTINITDIEPPKSNHLLSLTRVECGQDIAKLLVTIRNKTASDPQCGHLIRRFCCSFCMVKYKLESMGRALISKFVCATESVDVSLWKFSADKL